MSHVYEIKVTVKALILRIDGSFVGSYHTMDEVDEVITAFAGHRVP